MDQDNTRSPWYDQTIPSSGAQAPKKKKNRTGVKVTAITLCVLVLIAATAYIFSDRGRTPNEPVSPGNDGGFGNTIPTLPPDSSGDYADDFREFFDSFYVKNNDSPVGSFIERGETGTGVTLQTVSAAGAAELTLQELYQHCIDSVVGIRAGYRGSASYAWGTGIIMSPDGYILTNQHVIDEADTADVILSDGTEYPALLIGEDTQTDIAVLKIAASGLPAAVFGDSSELSVGDRVAAIGDPLGEELTGTMTDGIISAINRDIQVNGRRMTLLQTNAALNEGNSGGPLINMYGHVVGITNMKMVNYYSGVTIEGIGFAIPTSTVKNVAEQLIAKGEVTGRPGLGITVGAITEEAAAHYSLPGGLYITAVSAGSDAEAKGIVPGDILTHVNGQPVSETDDVLAIRDTLSVGDTMTLTIFRDGETFDVDITLFELNRLY